MTLQCTLEEPLLSNYFTLLFKFNKYDNVKKRHAELVVLCRVTSGDVGHPLTEPRHSYDLDLSIIIHHEIQQHTSLL